MLTGWMAVALALGELASGGMSGVPASRTNALIDVLAALVALAFGGFLFVLTPAEWMRVSLPGSARRLHGSSCAYRSRSPIRRARAVAA
jgi:hypothetical protein